MKIESNLHAWEVSASEAILIQNCLKEEIKIEPLAKEVRYVAGSDVSYNRFSNTIFACFIVMDIRTCEIVSRSHAVVETLFPYRTGLLTFREGPALLKAWEKLTFKPDVIFFDGQGIAHPRKLGIASHMGLWSNCPSLGCAKSLLVGTYTKLAEEPGSTTPLFYKNEEIGFVIRTKMRTAPVFVSAGHLIDSSSARDLTLKMVKKHRIPEPTRQAHNYVNEIRRSSLSPS